MYFNEKSDTDINKDISKSKKSIKKNKKIFKNNKSYLIIGIFIIIFIISLILIFANRKEYYIDLSGEEYIKIYEGSEYIEDANGYYAYDSKGNDLTNEVEVTNNIDNNTIGEYTVTYKLHNVTKERYISVIEKPNIATYIHLKGDEVIYLSINEEYIDPGYIAIDTVDSNLTKKVKVTNNIDNTKAGIYKVTYSVTNSSGVTSSAVRKVIVMDSEVSLSLSNTNPTNSDVSINIHITDNYYNYLILPNNNKITSKDYSYKVSSNGEYKFTIYNTKGKSVTKSISVTNIDKEAPTGSCSGYIQGDKSYITVSATDNIGIDKYVSNGVTNNGNIITLENAVTTPTVTIYDKAGNTKEITCTLEKRCVVNDCSRIFEKRSSSKAGLEYYLYVPANAEENMPLVVYLYGYGGDGTDGPATYINNGNEYPNTLILLPIVGVGHPQKDYNKNKENIITLINEIADTYKVNKKNINLTGFSYGCVGSFIVAHYAGDGYFHKLGFIDCGGFYQAQSIGKYSIDTKSFISPKIMTFAATGSGYTGSLYPTAKKIREAGNSEVGHCIIEGSHSHARNVLFNKDSKFVDWLVSEDSVSAFDTSICKTTK